MKPVFYKRMIQAFSIEGLDTERLYQIRYGDKAKLALVETEIKARGVF